jgi:hypothetical protein
MGGVFTYVAATVATLEDAYTDADYFAETICQIRSDELMMMAYMDWSITAVGSRRDAG